MNDTTPMTSDYVWNVTDFENFSFMGHRFDVRAAKRIITEAPRQIMNVRPADVGAMLGMIRTVPHLVDSADLTHPIVVATLGPKTKDEPAAYLPIDGWHRLARAVRDKVESIPAVLLTAAETDRIRGGR